MATAHPRVTVVGLQADKRLAGFGRDVAAGLTTVPKRLPCCYFYDRLGSALFEAICCLPEYYLTRAEEEILRAHSSEIAARFSSATDLIELGSGSAAKTRLLIEAFLARQREQRYVAVDICRTTLEEASLELVRDYPALTVLAIAGEYREALAHLRRDCGWRIGNCGVVSGTVVSPEWSPPTTHHSPLTTHQLVLWLGSNIGNLEREAAAQFLGDLRETLTSDDCLLVGIDLRKDRAVLEAAYDDPCGVTAAFNRNILARINRELGGHFDLRSFRHRAVYNEEIGRVEMYLVSERAQEVAIDRLDLRVAFAAGESIHTENSYKYAPAEIDVLAQRAGLRRECTWLDAGGRFSLNLFAPVG